MSNTLQNYREYRTVDKSNYKAGKGPWNDEPDKVQWIDPASGFDCLIVRNQFGALCGYVGVPEGHKYFEVDYNDTGELNVHGGLTFSDHCSKTEDESKHVCHVPAPGRADNIWWLGFDCAHGGDITPDFSGFDYGEYRTIEYVTREVTDLAKQLAEKP